MSTPAAPRIFPYALVDVFAERALEGNMLAIFTDARGLSDAEMQALARETNLSETTFILPADDPEKERQQGVRVRIFTTEEEFPFAGHPTLGTAAWLYQHHPVLRGADEITLKLNVGPIPVRFPTQDAAKPGVFAEMRQRDPVFGHIHSPEEVSRATGIPIADFDSSLPIQTVSTGLPFCMILLKSADALERIHLPQAESRRYLEKTDAKFFYVLAPAAQGSQFGFHARMQFYGGEDPATGSAAGCAISYLVHNKVVEAGGKTVLEQGTKVLRPSRLFVQAGLTDGEVTDVFVAGRTVLVATGQFSLPATGTFPQPIVTEPQQ